MAMSNLERQRILREAGTRPAQAEKESKADEAKHDLAHQGEPGQPPAGSEQELPTPLAQEDDRPGRPRR